MNSRQWQQILGIFAIAILAFGTVFVQQHTRQTAEKAVSVSLGMSQDDVQSYLGNPDKRQEMRSGYGKTEFWYYGGTQICFEESRVVSVNRY